MLSRLTVGTLMRRGILMTDKIGSVWRGGKRVGLGSKVWDTILMLICIALDLLIRSLIRVHVHGVVLRRGEWVRKGLNLDWILVIIVLTNIRHTSAAFGIIVNLDKILINFRFCGVAGVRKYTSKRPRRWNVTDVGGRYVKVFGDDLGLDWGFDHEGRLRKAWKVGDTWR